MTDQLVDPQVDAPTPTGTAETNVGEKAPNLTWALILISIAQLMVVLDATVTNIALPFIGADLTISQANLSWIVTGYSLAFGGLLLLGGRLGDLFGRRRMFVTGLSVFAVASLVGGLAQNEAMLLSSRALQGLGAALAAPAALALITTTFPAGPLRNRAFAVYAAMSGFGAAVGLILGGWLTGLDSVFGLSVHGWRMTFLINVPIGLVAAALAPRFLKESEAQDGRLDVPGAITGTLGLLGLVYGLTRAGQPTHGWDGIAVGSISVGILLLAVFAVVESRTAHPLLPLRILQNKNRVVSFVTMMIVPAAMFSMFYFLSQFIQNVMGYTPLRAGFAFLPFSVGIVIGAATASNLLNKIAPRFLAGTGTLLASISLFALSRISIDDRPQSVLAALQAGHPAGTDLSYWGSLFPWILLMATGMGMVFVPLTLTAVHHVNSDDSGIGSGVLNTMQQVGGAVGLATLSTVSLHYINERTASVASVLGPIKGQLRPQENPYLQATFTEGATHAFLAGSGLALLASVLIWVFLTVKPDELATDGPDSAPVHV